MDARLRGQLHALLTCVENNTKFNTQLDTSSILSKFIQLEQSIDKQEEKSDVLLKCLEDKKAEVAQTSKVITQLKAEIDACNARTQEMKTDKARLSYLEESLRETKNELTLMQNSNSCLKMEVSRLEALTVQKENKIQDLTTSLTDKSCYITHLEETLQHKEEALTRVESDLAVSNQLVTELRKELVTVKAKCEEDMTLLKIEMGEKVLKAQAQMIRQADNQEGMAVDGNPINYAEIFKKKMSHMEATYQKEIKELKHTISMLQQSQNRFNK